MTGHDEGRSSRPDRSTTSSRSKGSSSSSSRRDKSPCRDTSSRRHHDKERSSHRTKYTDKDQSSRNSGGRSSSRRDDQLEKLSFQSYNFILKRSSDLDEYYELGTLLGEGGFGACYTAQHRYTKVERACKILPNSPTDLAANEEAKAEFQMMAKLDHPNIAKVYELYQDNESFYIITDLYKGGDLFDLVEKGRLAEFDTAQVITSLLQAVSYLHQRNLCHRDLKPENILLDGSYHGIRVIDFGMSRFEDPKKPFTECLGSLEYVSPQVLSQKYTIASDVWSVGVIAFVLLGGRPPFNGDTDQEIAAAIQKGKFSFQEPFWGDISEDCKEFITQLLSFEEADRPTAEAALEHPWIERMRIKYLKDNDREIQGLIRDALAALERFRSRKCKLKQATCALLSAQFFTKKDRDILDPIYRALDHSFTGNLSMEDLHYAYWYSDFMGDERTDAQIQKIIKEVNFSQDGCISYSEFASVMMLETGLVDTERLEDVFDYFDASRKGEIDWRDLEVVLFPNKKSRTSEDACRKIIAEATDGASKTISFNAFKRIMLPKDRI